MKKHDLSNYKNLCDWAVRAHSLEDTSTLAEKKDDTLRVVNKRLGTNYGRTHIDNWIAGRVDTPKRVRELWLDELLEVEVEFDNPELGKQLRRLFD